MKNNEFLCMALECKNTVVRHPYNFGTGFCPECEEKFNGTVKENLTVDESPFCEKWKKEVMKFPKRELVNWLAKALKKINKNTEISEEERALNELIKGRTVYILDEEFKNTIQAELEIIKKNCITVLKQMKK